jgi:hypothetical protein
MNRGDVVKPRAFDHKSKMRLLEHGEEWKVDSDPLNPKKIGIVSEILLTSVKDGYQKWWKTDFIDETRETTQ